MDENALRAEPWDASRVLREALIRSALDSAERAEELGLPARSHRAVVQGQSGVQELIAVYRDLAARCDLRAASRAYRSRHGQQGHRRVHRGAGGAAAGRHRRHDPHFADARTRRSRTQEVDRRAGAAADDGPARVHAAWSPHARAADAPRRTFFQELAKTVQEHVRAKMPEWRITNTRRRKPDARGDGLRRQWPRRIAHANIGISLPGTGEAPAAPVFIDGEKTVTLRGDNIAADFVGIIDRYVERRYGPARPPPIQPRRRHPRSRPCRQAGRHASAAYSCKCHGWRLLLVFAGLLVPLWGFGGLVDALHEGEAFVFDVPILQAMHSMASTSLDRVLRVMSALGYAWGVVPADVLLVIALVLRRRMREGLFAATVDPRFAAVESRGEALLRARSTRPVAVDPPPKPPTAFPAATPWVR